MTLHEAIEKVLIDAKTPLSAIEIANIINRDSLYIRSDREYVTDNQIHARISNYANLFTHTENHKITIKQSNKRKYEYIVLRMKDCLRKSDSRFADIVIATCLFIKRVGSIEHDDFHKLLYPQYNYTTPISMFDEIIDDRIVRKIDYDDVALIGEILKSVNPKELSEIIDVMGDSDFSYAAMGIKEFGSFFNNYISSISLIKDSEGEFKTPQLISNLLQELSPIKNGDEIFDPFAGTGGIFTNFRNVENSFLVLNDIDRYRAWLGKMNLLLNGIKKFEYNCVDSLNTEKNADKQFDWIITHPPFGASFSKEELYFNHYRLFGNSKKPAIIYLEFILSHLKSNGHAVIIIPESFLFSSDNAHKYARQYLIENNWIESIISLPSGTFMPFTSAKASIITINKNRKPFSENSVDFYDIDDRILDNYSSGNQDYILEGINNSSRSYKAVTIEEIKAQECVLTVNRYVQENSPINEISDEHRKLKDLLLTKFSGYNSKKIVAQKTGIPFINIKDLSDSNKYFQLNLRKVESFITNDEFHGRKNAIIPKNSILVAKIGNKLKPTLYSSELPIAVSGNVLVLVPNNEVVLSTYLISQFYEEYVSNQIDRIRGGAAQPFVKIEDLLNIYIKIPSIKVQYEKELAFTLERFERIPDSELINVTHQDEEIDLLSAIKHEFNNLKNPLFSDFNNLNDFIQEKSVNGLAISWNDTITERVGARTIKDVMNHVSSIMSEMDSLFGDIFEVIKIDKNSSYLNKKRTNLNEYLQELSKSLQQEYPLCHIHLSFEDRKKFFLNIDSNLFSKVVRNFVKNTDRHGYDDQETTRLIDIVITNSEDDLNVNIELIDDGKGFADGYDFADFISFGRKAGASKGSGIGGFIMNRIVQYHGGTFDMLNNQGATKTPMGEALYPLKKSFRGTHFIISIPK